MLNKIEIKTEKRNDTIVLNNQIQSLIEASGIKDGFCIVANPHSTAGLYINSYLDPLTLQDISETLQILVPTRIDFHHQFDTPSDAAGHIKSVIVGNNETIIINDGKLVLGHSQGIIFAEFDGPRERHVFVSIIEVK